MSWKLIDTGQGGGVLACGDIDIALLLWLTRRLPSNHLIGVLRREHGRIEGTLARGILDEEDQAWLLTIAHVLLDDLVRSVAVMQLVEQFLVDDDLLLLVDGEDLGRGAWLLLLDLLLRLPRIGAIRRGYLLASQILPQKHVS